MEIGLLQGSIVFAVRYEHGSAVTQVLLQVLVGNQKMRFLPVDNQGGVLDLGNLVQGHASDVLVVPDDGGGVQEPEKRLGIAGTAPGRSEMDGDVNGLTEKIVNVVFLLGRDFDAELSQLVDPVVPSDPFLGLPVL